MCTPLRTARRTRAFASATPSLSRPAGRVSNRAERAWIGRTAKERGADLSVANVRGFVTSVKEGNQIKLVYRVEQILIG